MICLTVQRTNGVLDDLFLLVKHVAEVDLCRPELLSDNVAVIL